MARRSRPRRRSCARTAAQALGVGRMACHRARLGPVMKLELLDQLMDALGDMVEMTCPMMRVFWLDHSRAARQELCEQLEPLPEYPAYLRALGAKATRSKYRAFAGWRHVVVWRALLDGKRAMKTIYFE